MINGLSNIQAIIQEFLDTNYGIHTICKHASDLNVTIFVLRFNCDIYCYDSHALVMDSSLLYSTEYKPASLDYSDPDFFDLLKIDLDYLQDRYGKLYAM